MKNGSHYRMRGNQNLFLLFLFALCMRLIFWIFVVNHPERAFDNDSKEYLPLAETLLDSHSFPSVLRTPVYPFFIASVYSLFGKFPQAVLVFQYLLDSATAVIVTLLFFKIFRSAKYSFLAGFLYAINPFAIFYSNMILTETVFTFILAISMFFFISFLRSQEKIQLYASAILLGIAALCRPMALYIPFLLVPCIFLAAHTFRYRVISVLIFLMISYLALMPWYMKNYRDYGKWTLSTIGNLNYVVSFAPEVLMIKDDPLSVATFNVNEKIEHFQKVLRLEAAQKYGRREDNPSGTSDAAERSSVLLKEAKRLVYENFHIFIGSHLANIGRVLCPYHPYFEKLIGNNLKIISLISFTVDFLIMGFFLSGLVFSLKGAFEQGFDKITFLAMIILIAYFSFIPGIVGYSRFRVPILPYISIFSALGVQQITNRKRSGK